MAPIGMELSSDVSNQDVVNWHEKPPKYEPKCWKQEAENMILYGDQKSIDALYKFGLVDNVCTALKGLEPCSFQTSDLPSSGLWDCRLSQLKKEIPSIVATRLSQQSLHKFRRVPFEAWTRAAFGGSSQEIASFFWQYEYLSARLYYDFLRDSSPNQITALLQVIQVSSLIMFTLRLLRESFLTTYQSLKDAEADPFVLAAIDDALKSIVGENANTEALAMRLDDISFHLMVEPMQQLLRNSGSVHSILQQLKVLEVRFRSHYYGSEVNWVPFDTRNEFLKQIRLLGTSGLAEGLSREDVALFQKLDMHSFTTENHEVLHILVVRWSRLSHLVMECVDAGVVDALEIDLLAKVNHNMPFYILTGLTIIFCRNFAIFATFIL